MMTMDKIPAVLYCCSCGCDPIPMEIPANWSVRDAVAWHRLDCKSRVTIIEVWTSGGPPGYTFKLLSVKQH